jgi:hypothetical protein
VKKKMFQLCQRCEDPIIVNAYLVMPGQEYDEGRNFCLKCALDTVREESKTEIKRVTYLKAKTDEERSQDQADLD